MKNRLVIFGCGGHGKSVLDVVLHNNDYADILFVDENAKEYEKILGFSVVKDYKIQDEAVFIAIGDNKKRIKYGEKYYKYLVSVVSKNAYIGKNVEIGKGVFVGHNASVGIFSKLKDFSIINTSASIDHECVIESGAFIAPNATFCGNIAIGKNTFIGAGATIIENVKICNNVIIGAGAIVVKNIDKEGTYIGCPAKRSQIK